MKELAWAAAGGLVVFLILQHRARASPPADAVATANTDDDGPESDFFSSVGSAIDRFTHWVQPGSATATGGGGCGCGCK